jgi:hypothetical protein
METIAGRELAGARQHFSGAGIASPLDKTQFLKALIYFNQTEFGWPRAVVASRATIRFGFRRFHTQECARHTLLADLVCGLICPPREIGAEQALDVALDLGAGNGAAIAG